jgi:hypothetical protein
MSKHFFASITRNWISLIGCAIALVSAVLIITLYFVESIGHQGGPYLGILTFLILPAIFALGLILVPLGIYFERRRMRKHPEYEGRGPFPVIDLNTPKTRGALMVFLGLTVLNIVVLAGATYKGVEVMESVEFCGMACHTVMEPEYTAYQRSPHSRVTCAECHIGPGADWFVKSKLDGAWQLVAVAFDLYPTPIETPLHDLRPARETCEQCHWPSKFHGDKLDIKTTYDDNEQNTELKTAVLLKVGGANGRDSTGIHWHVAPENEVRYRSDESREDIYEVRLVRPDGTEKVWLKPDAPEDDGLWRTMDCVDCHNRPSHQYRQPEEEVDNAIHDGRIDQSLPFVKREAVRIIDQKFETRDEARTVMAAELASFYEENYPEIAAEKAVAIEQAGETLGDLYSVNVFPHMKVWWNTYPDHIGHQQSPGCFRCHNRELKTVDGDGITRRCSTCHTVLAREEENPEILTELRR